MDGQDELSPPDDGEDFGTFLGRRVRSYQTGVLGVGGLDLGNTPSADGGGIISRSIDFSNSLQSLLSYRSATLVANPPGSAGDVNPATTALISREADPAGESEPDPVTPLRFGTPEWIARMNENRKVVEEKESHQYSLNAPPLSAIESALGISGGDPAEPAGPGPIRRRPAIREMSGTAEVPPNRTASGPTPLAAIPAAAPAFDETPEPPPAARTTGQASEASAPPEVPRVAAPIVQRRARRGSSAAVPPPPAAAPVQPTGQMTPTTVSQSDAGEPGEATAAAPIVRRRVIPPPNDNSKKPPEGRQGVRRVTPAPPQRPGGGPLLRTPSVDPVPSAPADGVAAGSSRVIETLREDGAPPALSNVAPEAAVFRSAEPATTPSAAGRDVGSLSVPNQPDIQDAPQSAVSNLSPAVEPPTLAGFGAAQVPHTEPSLRRSVDASPPLAATADMSAVQNEPGSERTGIADSGGETPPAAPVDQPRPETIRESVQRQLADSPAAPAAAAPSNRAVLPTTETAAPASDVPVGGLAPSIPAPRILDSSGLETVPASSEATLPIQRAAPAPESPPPSEPTAVQPATSTPVDRPEPGGMPTGEVQRQVISAEPPVETVALAAPDFRESAPVEGPSATSHSEPPTAVTQRQAVETAETGPSGEPAVALPAPSAAGAEAPRGPLPNNLGGTLTPSGDPPPVVSRRVDVAPNPAIQQPSATTVSSMPSDVAPGSSPPSSVEARPQSAGSSSTETPRTGSPVAPVELLTEPADAEPQPAEPAPGGRTQVEPIRRFVDAEAPATPMSDSAPNAVRPIAEPSSATGVTLDAAPVASPDTPVAGPVGQQTERTATGSVVRGSVPVLPLPGPAETQGPSPTLPAPPRIARLADPASPSALTEASATTEVTEITTTSPDPAAASISTPAAPGTQQRPEAVQRLSIDPPAAAAAPPSLAVPGDVAGLARSPAPESEFAAAATLNQPNLQRQSLPSAPAPASSTSIAGPEAVPSTITAPPAIEGDTSVRRTTVNATGPQGPTDAAHAAVEPSIDSPAPPEQDSQRTGIVLRSPATLSPEATANPSASGPATTAIASAGSPAVAPPSSTVTSTAELPAAGPAPQAAGIPRAISRLPEIEPDAMVPPPIESMPVAPVNRPVPASADQPPPLAIQRIVDSTPAVSIDAPEPSRPLLVAQPPPAVDRGTPEPPGSSMPLPIQPASEGYVSSEPGSALGEPTRQAPVAASPSSPGIQRSSASPEAANATAQPPANGSKVPVAEPPVRQRAIPADSDGAFEGVTEGMVMAPHAVAGTAPGGPTVQRSVAPLAPSSPARTVRPPTSVPVRVNASSPAFTPPSMPLPRAVQRTSEPVDMPLAPPMQREAAPTSPSGPATGTIQRVETANEQALSESGGSSGGSSPNYDQIADAVWPHLKRKLRIERERERGLPS